MKNTCCTSMSVGLGKLDGVERVLIKQRETFDENLIKNFCPCVEMPNTYYIQTRTKELYTFNEESNTCCRWFCSPSHPLELTQIDTRVNNVSFDKPFRLIKCFNTPCSLSEMRVLQNGEQIGYVKEDWKSCFEPRYQIYKGNEEIPFDVLIGPSVFGGMFELSQGETPVAQTMSRKSVITKLSDNKTGRSVLETVVADSDTYAINFRNMSDVQERTLLVASALLLDYQIFENDTTNAQACYCCSIYLCGCVCSFRIPFNGGQSGGRVMPIR